MELVIRQTHREANVDLIHRITSDARIVPVELMGPTTYNVGINAERSPRLQHQCWVFEMLDLELEVQ